MSESGSHLRLWDWLDEASQVVEQVPELVQVADGVAALELVMKELLTEPTVIQLAIAAEAIARLSSVLNRKSEEWLTGWDRQADEGMTPDPDWTVGLVRQSVVFDLSPLLAIPDKPPRQRLRPAKDSSIAAPVAVETMLAMVEQLELDQLTVQTQLAALAGEEMPQHWQSKIAQVLAQHQQTGQRQMTFTQLLQQTGLAPVELWLGLLLGGYSLEAISAKSHAKSQWLDSAQAFYHMEIRVTIA